MNGNRFVRMTAFFGVVGVVLLGWSCPVQSRELLTFDDGHGEQWAVLANSKLELWKPAETIAEPGLIPTGRALRVSGGAGSGLVMRSKSVADADWRKSARLVFWLHRTLDEAKLHPRVSLDVHLIEADRQAYFWRRLDVEHSGWKKIELPLDWFRWSNSRIPSWDKVQSLALLLREPATLTIDTISAVPAETPRGDFPSVPLIAPLAFPAGSDGQPPANVRSLETRDVQLLTDATSLDLEQLAGHLATVAKDVRREMPFLPEPEQGPLLVIFQRHEDYRQFVPRYAKQLNGEASPPTSAGFTVEGVSASSWDSQYGTLRPVYTHEFLHGYLCRTMRLASHGDWLHEGLASHFQLKFHPQANLSQIILAGLKSPRAHDPLKELCDGHRIGSTRYWQAATLCQMLMTDPRFRAGFSKLVDRLRASSSNDLAPHLEAVWSTDFDGLTADWRAFCQQTYGK